MLSLSSPVARAETKNEDRSPWALHLSGGGVLFKRTFDLEATIGPSFCDRSFSSDVCWSNFYTVGGDEHRRYIATGLGYYGHAHGFMGGMFIEYGQWKNRQADEVGGHFWAFTIGGLLLPPLQFRWSRAYDGRRDYEVGVVLKLMDVRGRFP